MSKKQETGIFEGREAICFQFLVLRQKTKYSGLPV
jgi:hypothetical protein